MERYKIYAAGEFIDGPKRLDIRRPFDSGLFAVTTSADQDILHQAIMAARKAVDGIAGIPSHQRSRILDEIADGILDKREKFTRIICEEAGKPYRFSMAEVDRAIQVFRIAAEETRRIPGEYLSLDWTVAGEGKEGWVRYFPLGVVGAISPFNFPLNLAVHKLAPAIASGNAVILKPASQTPVSVLELAKIIDATSLPKGAVSILPMDRSTGTGLVTDPGVDMITFTGSPEVGWKLKALAGRKKVTLELGGNAGVLVSRSADLNLAVNKCVAGGFAYSGQVCIHVQRIFVLKEHYPDFITRFVGRTLQLKRGNPLEPHTDISVMIDEENAARIETWVEEARQGGAEILAGGHREGNWFEPTVLTNTRNDMKVSCQEAFAPMVLIEPVETFADGVRQINDSVFGLQAGVYTNEIEEMNQAFREIRVGGVVINDVPTFRVDHMPYGGVKESGFGREGVRYAMLDMMEPKLLVKNQ